MAPTKKQTPSAAAAAAAAVPPPPVAKAPEPEPVKVEAEPVTADEASAVAADGDIGARIAAALEKQQAILAASKELIAFFKGLQKEVAKLQKRDGRKQRHSAAAAAGGAPRKLSGFAKPTSLSGDLCDFLGVPSDSMLARTEVTRLLNKYVKDNNLQDAANKRIIRPDAKLQKVLAISGDTQLTYFNLQSHIKHHFIKAPVEVPPVAA
jgi:chromatin remodeling complex protein RSC6